MSRRGLTTVLAVAAMLLGLPATASAVSVKVVDLNGKPHTVDLGQNVGEQDVTDTDYAIRSGSGTTPRTVSGFSLNKIIDLADADTLSYTYLEIDRPDGGVVSLTNKQVRESGSPDGPPVVYEDGGSVGFIRPSVGDGDKNAGDVFSTPNELVIKLEDGSPIDVSVTASDEKVEVGDEVNFTATVTHPKTLEPDIRWTFDEGSIPGGKFMIHKFKTAGTYNVAVSATNPENGQGPSAYVEIQVGAKKKRGPDRKGGGKDKDDDAPDSGSSEDTGGTVGGTTAGPGSPGPAVPVTPAVPAPVTPETPQPDRNKPDREPTTGEEVSGELLQDAVVVAPEPETKPEKEKAQTARTGTEAGDGFGIPGAALGGMSVLALLGIGGLAQAGKIRPDSMLWHANRLVGR